MVPVYEDKMPFLDCLYYNHSDQYRYKEASKLACHQRGIPYLDIFDQWMAHEHFWRLQRLSADGFHPNTLGCQTLLEDVIKWQPLAAYLKIA